MLQFPAINGTNIESGSSGVVLDLVSFASKGAIAKPAGEPSTGGIEAKLPRAAHPLTEVEAVEIWIARWLRIRRKDLIAKYGCDSRRLYEIWWGDRYPHAKDKARELFTERYPGLVDRTTFSYRRIPRKPARPDLGEQGDLFRQS